MASTNLQKRKKEEVTFPCNVIPVVWQRTLTKGVRKTPAWDPAVTVSVS